MSVAIINPNDIRGWDIRGLSTDTKPTENIPDGSSFLEKDTGDIYFWDKGTEEWNKFSGGGGGGGTGDMNKSVYDPEGEVAEAGGIPAYVEEHSGGTLRVNFTIHASEGTVTSDVTFAELEAEKAADFPKRIEAALYMDMEGQTSFAMFGNSFSYSDGKYSFGFIIGETSGSVNHLEITTVVVKESGISTVQFYTEAD